jgi:hypothetical protein
MKFNPMSSPLFKTYVYLKMSGKTLASQPSMETTKDLLKFFPHWWRHLNPQRNSVNDKYPWLTFGAIRFIEKIVRPDMTVFEYGSGGSTLFWSQRVEKVFSVEHNRGWYEKMRYEFEVRKIDNVEYMLVEAENDPQYSSKNPENPHDYISTDSEFIGKKFDAYAKKIEKVSVQSFDVIIVDGRARPSCILHALKRVKPQGYLIVDNTDRKYYLSPFSFSKEKWSERVFNGPVPYIFDFSQTTIFQKLSS